MIKRYPKLNHFLLEKSALIFSILLVLMGSLLFYTWHAQQEVMKLAYNIEESHRLSVKALLLSDENYHTQLELYEYYVAPNQERLEAFFEHEVEFYKRLNEAHQLYKEHSNLVSQDNMDRMEKLKARIPIVHKEWHDIIDAIKSNKPKQETLKLLIKSEHQFDDIGLNNEIKTIVENQAASLMVIEKRIQVFNGQHNLVLLIGIFVAFLLCGIVTILHKAALQGKINQIQLIQASKLASLGELSAGVAHEINNPLMFIKGFNERIKNRLQKVAFDPKSDVWDNIDEVNSGVDRIQKIVQHFKDLAHLSDQQMTAVQINPLLVKSIDLFKEQLRLKGINVNFNLSSEEPWIIGNANRLEQIFLNFISNSKDSLLETSKINKTITISSSIQNNFVIITFADNGTGIPSEITARIFDPFFTTKPIGKGTGLGLSISQGIIQDHRGTIKVSSQLNEGAQFIISFPLEARMKKVS